MGTPLSLLVPLYVYPAPGAWLPLTDRLSQSSVSASVIVNPGSGPGPFPPVDPYINGVSNLTALSNVQILGYVDTAYSNRALSDVYADIDQYAKWASYSAANITISGIFFDDVKNDNSSSNINYLKQVTSYAKSHIPAQGNVPVVLNTGVTAKEEYFSFADIVIEYEQTYGNYTNDTLIASIPSQYRAQSAILINQVPAGTNDTTDSWIHYMHQSGIGYVWYTDDDGYRDLNDAGSVVDAVEQA